MNGREQRGRSEGGEIAANLWFYALSWGKVK